MHPLPRRLLSFRTSPITSPTCPQCHSSFQSRQASTLRRHKKLLNLPPATSFGGPTSTTGSSGRSRLLPHAPSHDHIVFNPAPSAPNPHHTPLKFLPKDDPRRPLYTRRAPAPSLLQIQSSLAASGPADASSSAPPQQQGDTVYYTSTSTALPPPLRQPYTKSYHLTEADMAEMRSLRQADEAHWTREKLADKFKCSQLFVGMVVQASEGRLRALAQAREHVRDGWGLRRRTAREDRARRRELWARDE